MRKPTRAAGRASDLVVFACAAAAGIHAGLVPAHLREEPRVGVAFVLAVVLLLPTGAALARRPADPPIALAAALVLGGLVVAYAASRTTGIPLLAPDPEAVDGVGIGAVTVEMLGLVFALRLAQPIGRHWGRHVFQEVSR